MGLVSGCGRTGPDPGADITLTDGTIVPSGKGTNTTVPTSSLLYNEYPSMLRSVLFSPCSNSNFFRPSFSRRSGAERLHPVF